MVSRTYTPPLNPAGGSPREVADKVNAILRGKINSVGQITLAAASATTTTLSDPNIGLDTKVFLFPTTANAAAIWSTTYKSAAAKGQITLTHSANVLSDRTFDYLLIG